MPRPRTLQQNKSLHKFCKLLADELNARGITQAMFVAALEIDNSAESVKNAFREMGFNKYLANSTAKLSTSEMSDIYKEMDRVVSQWGIQVDWPSDDKKSFEETYK